MNYKLASYSAFYLKSGDYLRLVLEKLKCKNNCVGSDVWFIFIFYCSSKKCNVNLHMLPTEFYCIFWFLFLKIPLMQASTCKQFQLSQLKSSILSPVWETWLQRRKSSENDDCKLHSWGENPTKISRFSEYLYCQISFPDICSTNNAGFQFGSSD